MNDIVYSLLVEELKYYKGLSFHHESYSYIRKIEAKIEILEDLISKADSRLKENL